MSWGGPRPQITRFEVIFRRGGLNQPPLTRAEGIKLFLEFHHFACFIQCTYMCRFRKSLYGNSSFTKKSENPLQKVSNLL